MHYDTALTWVYSLTARGARYELDRMRRALARRGHPERALPVVHVTGSNGKGSTSAMIERGLRAAGKRTGLFTSPHLHRYVERFRIDGRVLGDAEVARRLSDIRTIAERRRDGLPRLTFFEISVLLALEAFRDHECDVVVLEVGLGGRLDATNTVTHRLASVVTGIALEHKGILGDTVEKIAREKGGILQRERPAVIGVRERGPREVLRRMARRRGCPTQLVGRDFEGVTLGPRRAKLRVGDDERVVKLGLEGAHQANNAAVAAAALRAIGTPWEAVVAGIERARWPGRLERRRIEGREVLFDCAHNPEGCEALAAHLRALPAQKTVLLFGALADKDLPAMLGAFDDVVDRRVYVTPPSPRAPAAAGVYAGIRPGTEARSLRDGLARAQRAAGEDGRVVIAGSLFLVAAARAALLGLRTDD